MSTTTLGIARDSLSPPLSTGSLLNTPTPMLLSPSVATGTSSSPSSLVSPAPPLGSTTHGDPNGLIFVFTDGNGFVYTTTVYSTQNSSQPTSTIASNLNLVSTGGLTAIIAGIGGGVGLLLLVVGVAWFFRVRGAKRRAGQSVITDRKFYPDKYNQTVTSNRHSEYNEIEPGPVVAQLPPPHPPPPPLLRQASSLSSGPLSGRNSSYQNNIPFPRTRGDWAGGPTPDGVLKDIPPLTRHRVPYPSSPTQPLVDRYTMLPSRSTSGSNTQNTPLRFALNPPHHRPHHSRPSSFTHRRYHSHHSFCSGPQDQLQDVERDSFYPPIATPHPSVAPRRMARRNTIFVSPPMTPSSFTALSSPPLELSATSTEPTTVTLSPRPSIARSTFSSVDPLTTTTRRMMCTNPDSDIDLESDTEPDGSERSGSRGSPSATDIIRLYDRDRDPDASATSSMLREKDG